MDSYRLSLILLTLAACSGDGKGTDTDDTDVADTETMDSEMMDTDPGMMEPTDAERAASLWAAIADSASWDQPTGWEGIQYRSDDASPHGPWVEIFMNDVAANSWAGLSGGGELAEGAILVKRYYDTSDAAEPQDVYLVMQRIEGYGATDWFWASFDGTGAADPLGDVGMCTGCHSSGLDYVRAATDVPGTPPT